MSHDTIVALSVLGVVGQVLIALLLLVGVLALVGVHGPLDLVRNLLWGYELWAAFIVASIATGGSLFYSQIAHFQPCEFCWFQRVLMYPLSILTLFIAGRGDNRAARYLLPLPVVGAGTAIYHMLIAYGAIHEPAACTASAAGGCAFNWLAVPSVHASFGYLQIPTLALTGFLLLIGFLVLASAGEAEAPATLPPHAERQEGKTAEA
ncbi:MAG TPA: disulfide bond formation protein B [Gaiellaceae bacterium]|nr:disulfide bond formation protein B [Gaiellaceae bacterium]